MTKRSQGRIPPHWRELERHAKAAGGLGKVQWRLVRAVLELSRRHRRGIAVGRQALAQLTAVDDPKGSNTRKRERRMEQLRLFSIARGGGRFPGCRKDGEAGLVGLANRLYPGEDIYPATLVARLIEADEQAEQRKRERFAAAAEDPGPCTIQKAPPPALRSG